MTARRLIALIILCAWPVVIGCSDGLAKVGGTVTLDNQPVNGSAEIYGTVTFTREAGGATAVGIIDGSGRYVITTGSQKGVEPGAYLVSIAVKKISPPKTLGAMPEATLISPKKYASATTSGLRQEVKAGSNTCDFALTSKP